MAQEYAYLTGGASGIGREVARMLVKNKIKVFIADRDLDGAQKVVEELNQSGIVAKAAHVDVANWNSQAKAFSQAVADFGRLDYVYAIAGVGEQTFIPNNPNSSGFVMPNLTTLDVDLTGVLYTASLAIQQFRRQDPGKNGFRGKIVVVSSICGFYAVPTIPIYTAAKHGVVGFVRSYGKYLPEEKITLNSVNPNVVRTNISNSAFYDKLEGTGLLTPVSSVVDAFERLLGANDASGECYEVGPHWEKQGPVTRGPPEYLDEETRQTMELVYQRARPLHLPK